MADKQEPTIQTPPDVGYPQTGAELVARHR